MLVSQRPKYSHSLHLAAGPKSGPTSLFFLGPSGFPLNLSPIHLTLLRFPLQTIHSCPRTFQTHDSGNVTMAAKRKRTEQSTRQWKKVAGFDAFNVSGIRRWRSKNKLGFIVLTARSHKLSLPIGDERQRSLRGRNLSSAKSCQSPKLEFM